MRDFEAPGRSVVVGRKAMAATSHPSSTLTAIEILKSGGNAMDAAVAACAVQSVVESGSTGIGGDCFALWSRRASPEIVAYNGSGRTPAAASLEWYKARNILEIDRQSVHAVTLPGAVDAWCRLIKDHGKLPLSEVLAPAIAFARDGYAISPRVAFDLMHQQELLRADPTAKRTYLTNGSSPKAGQMQRQPELATTLEMIGREGPDAFYRGRVASDMADFLQSKGGLHTAEDFAKTEGEYVTPISAEYRGRTIVECPPNGQGIIALMILKILSRFRPKPDPLDVDNLHIEVEATRLAYAARDAYVADMGMSDVPIKYLLSDKLADDLASRIDLSKAIKELPTLSAAEHSDTVYISVVDEERNVVSFINSLFHVYGCGLVEPKSGVLFHSRGQSFVLNDGHPNVIGPRKRPMHTIIPGMVVQDGKVSMSFGVMGGHYQAMGHAHLLSKMFDHGLDMQSAMDLPRLFPLPGTAIIETERLLRDMAGPELVRRGFEVRPPRWAIGGAQGVSIDWKTNTLFGASDHRKDGCALGF
jgi:gamma-glutamyltranspeptidase / glutathione hydrolase